MQKTRINSPFDTISSQCHLEKLSVPVLILAGGFGTRLRPLTETIPKCLVPIGGIPLLEYWMFELARCGITDITVNTHHLSEAVRAYLLEVNARLELNAREFYEPTLLGSAGTIAANPELCDEADCCFLIYADNFSDVHLDELLAFHRSHDQPLTMLLFHTAQPEACGIATLDEEQRVTEFIEKPQYPMGNLANGGIYVVSKSAYGEIARLKAFDLGFDVLPHFVGRMKGFIHHGLHLDIGNIAALNEARGLVAKHFGERLSMQSTTDSSLTS